MTLTCQIPQNDAVDVAFDGAGAVGEGESVADRVMIGLQTPDEPVQLRQVIRLDRSHPGVEIVAAEVGEHLRKGGNVGGGGFEMPAAGVDLFEPDLLRIGQVVGAAQHPGRDLADLRHRLSDRCGSGLP